MTNFEVEGRNLNVTERRWTLGVKNITKLTKPEVFTEQRAFHRKLVLSLFHFLVDLERFCVCLPMTAHDISDFIDSIKEHLTDAQYKEGMEICQSVFTKKKEASAEKLYRMTYLRPYTFVDDHCDDEDCDDMIFRIAFSKVVALVKLSDARAERIRTDNMFYGSDDDMKPFIDLQVLRSFPADLADLDSDVQWYEFPVISIELVDEEEA